MTPMVDLGIGTGTRRAGAPSVRRVPRQPELAAGVASPPSELFSLRDTVFPELAPAAPAPAAPPAPMAPMAPEVLRPEVVVPDLRVLPACPAGPALPELPQLPALPDIGELVERSDCNPLADRHVAVVGIHYAPELTGVAPYTTAMAEHLADRARLVTVLTGLPHYPTWRVPAGYRGFRRNAELHTPSLHLIRHGHSVPKRMTRWSAARYQAGFALSASRTRLDQRPDLVIAVTPSPSGAIAGARLAERHGCPLVLVVQDLVASRGRMTRDVSTGAMVSGRPVGWLARLEAAALRQADRVVVRSEAMVAAVIACGVAENRIDAVPVWPTAPTADLDRSEARHRLGWARDTFTVVYTGDMGPAQGLEVVVDAARELKRRGQQMRFVLAGQGTHRRALQSKIRSAACQDLVEVVDQIDADDASTMMAAADLLVLSERPGVGVGWLPGTVPAYLSAGRPIVAAASPLGVIGRDLVRSGACQMVEPGDVEGLSDAVSDLNRSQNRRMQLSAAADGCAAQAYQRSDAMRELETTVARVLAGI